MMSDVQFSNNGFEIQTCSRCCGSGRYSYCTMYGDVCFKCSGKGRVFTARGLVAHAFFLELFKVPAESLKVGDQIQHHGRKSRIVRIELTELKGVSNGVEYCVPGLTIETVGRSYVLPVDYLIAKLVAPDVFADRLRQAIEYQANLTKAGKPRKSRKAVG